MFGVVVYLKDFEVRRERRSICSIWIAIMMMDYGLTASGHAVQQLIQLRVKMPLLLVLHAEVEGLEHRQPQSSDHLHRQT